MASKVVSEASIKEFSEKLLAEKQLIAVSETRIEFGLWEYDIAIRMHPFGCVELEYTWVDIDNPRRYNHYEMAQLEYAVWSFLISAIEETII